MTYSVLIADGVHLIGIGNVSESDANDLSALLIKYGIGVAVIPVDD